MKGSHAVQILPGALYGVKKSSRNRVNPRRLQGGPTRSLVPAGVAFLIGTTERKGE